MRARLSLPCAFALGLASVCCNLGLAADLPEPPDFPWEKGGKIQIGPQKTDYALPLGAFPQLEALLPKVAPEQNAARWYLAAINAWTLAPDGLDQLRPGHEQWQKAQPEIAKWLAANALAFEYLDQAAQKAACRWPFLVREAPKPGKQPLAYGLLLPHLSKVRGFARARALAARAALTKGDLDAALKHVESGLKIGQHGDGEVLFIEALVSNACDAIALEIVEDLLCLGRLTAAQLTRLAQALDARRATLSNGLGAIKTEECVSLQTLDQLLQGKLDARELGGDGMDLTGWQELVGSRAFRIVFPDRTMRKQMADYFSAVQARMKEPYFERADPDKFHDELLAKIPRWNILARMLLPVLGRVGTQFVIRSAQVDLARTAVALKQVALETGKRPAALADLAPKYLKSVPVDPFTGKPLSYVTGAGGWRVYSVGQDLKDDGGKRTDARGPDLVFYLEDAPGRVPPQHGVRYVPPQTPPEEF